MKHAWVITILLVASLAAVGAKKDKDKNDDKPRGGSGSDAAAQTVTIRDLQFVPAQVTVDKGTTVVWINRDDHDHTVQADDGSFDSGNIRSGQRYKKTFEKSGTYKYSCKYHPRMKGTVTVK